MLWIATAVALVASIVALMAVILVKRPIGVDELGAVSHRWIVEHRVD